MLEAGERGGCRAAHLCLVISGVQQGKGLHQHSQRHGALLQQVCIVGQHAEGAAHEAWVGVAHVPHHKAGLRGRRIWVLVPQGAVLFWSIAFACGSWHLRRIYLRRALAGLVGRPADP